MKVLRCCLFSAFNCVRFQFDSATELDSLVDDPSVLYFSVHRYEKGEFFPYALVNNNQASPKNPQMGTFAHHHARFDDQRSANSPS